MSKLLGCLEELRKEVVDIVDNEQNGPYLKFLDIAHLPVASYKQY